MATIIKTGVIINDKECSKIHFAANFDVIKSILIDDEEVMLGDYMVDRVEHTITFLENIPKGAEINVLYTVEDEDVVVYNIPTVSSSKPVGMVFEEKENNNMSDIYLSNTYEREDIYKKFLNSVPAFVGVKPITLPTITISNDFVKDVKVVVKNKIVEVTFKDDEKIKTVCDESDTFSLENAISIAIMKKLLGGTGAYNKAIKNGMKAYKNRIESEKKKAEEEKKIAEKKVKAKIRRERRAARKKEAHIQEQAEIMARAMKMAKEV